MGTNNLNVKESMDIIAAAIAELRQEEHVSFYTDRITLENDYKVKVKDPRIINHFFQVFDIQNFVIIDKSAITQIDIPYDVFRYQLNTQLDELDKAAGVKLFDSLQTTAKKRCKYLLKHAIDESCEYIRSIDPKFIELEATKIINTINGSKGTKLTLTEISSFRSGIITIVLSDDRVLHNKKPADDTTFVNAYIPIEYYTADDYWPELDSKIGKQHFIYDGKHLKRNGALRMAYVIFNVVGKWLRIQKLLPEK